MTVTTALAFALIFVGAYFRDIEQSDVEANASPSLGTVFLSTRDVARRPTSRMLWSELPPQHSVYAHDVIRTGADSEVGIDLGAAGTLKLGKDSLVILETQRDGLRVNVASGELFVKGSILAKVGDTEVKSDAAVMRISANSATKNLRVESQSGKVTVTTAAQKSDVKAGAVLNRDAKGTQTLTDYPLVRTHPADGTTVELHAADDPVPFALKPTGPVGPGPWLLQIAREAQFKQLVRSAELKALDDIPYITLKDGHYFWRVLATDHRTALSSTGGFEVIGPQTMAWNGSGEFQAALSARGLDLKMDWKPVRKANFYSVHFYLNGQQVEEDRTDSASLNWQNHQSPLTQTLATLRDASQEKISVEVRAHFGGDQSTSLRLLGHIQFKDARAPQKLSLAQAELTNDWRNTQLTWKSEGQATSYQVRIGSKVFNLESSLHSVTTTDFWDAEHGSGESPAVRVIAASGAAGPWTSFSWDQDKFAIVKFVRQAPSPVYPVDGTNFIKRNTPRVILTWQSEGSAMYQPQNYEVEVKGPNGFQPVVASTTQPRFDLGTIPQGSYSWRVRSHWKDFGPGPFMRAQNFSLVGGAPLQAPKLRRPAAQRNQDDE
ncbi:MAG: hypothetical protein JST16_06585 [Bdellovibrionales bacterium]|nr:hypothetical protein [Bdellovibrionales bacterium]